ncbi:MAG: glutathione synthase [Spirochaetota bacterium]|nr:glutathione synthase [Spirochaetota bacterium]
MSSKLKWLFVIDPIESLNPSTDTTYAIMLEVFRRDIQTYCCTIQDLFFNSTVVCTLSSRVYFDSDEFHLGNKQESDLDSFDMIFMRKEPPYDYNFHYATQMLSLTGSLVVNSPKALRDFNEKLIIFNFPTFIPKTIVSSDNSRIIEFIRQNKGISILKDLNSYQGRGVKKISADDPNLRALLDESTHNQSVPVMVQEFVPNVKRGDKRILILGGKPIGAVNRVPEEGSYLANFGQGGEAQRATITENEIRMINSFSTFLTSNKIYLAGIDVIDGYLTEINITCPTGLQQINRLEGIRLQEQIVDYFQDLTV